MGHPLENSSVQGAAAHFSLTIVRTYPRWTAEGKLPADGVVVAGTLQTLLIRARELVVADCGLDRATTVSFRCRVTLDDALVEAAWDLGDRRRRRPGSRETQADVERLVPLLHAGGVPMRDMATILGYTDGRISQLCCRLGLRDHSRNEGPAHTLREVRGDGTAAVPVSEPSMDFGCLVRVRPSAIEKHDSAVAREAASAYLSGATVAELADRLSYTKQAVRHLLREQGVKVRPQQALPRDPAWWSGQLATGKTKADLAAELGVHRQSINRVLAEIGLGSERSSDNLETRLRASTKAEGDCLRWTAGRSRGYPLMGWRGRKALVTRVVWEQRHGAIPPGFEVVHTDECRFRDCVRLAHLQAQPTAQRLADAAAQGLYPRGERHWNAKLTTAEVMAIRSSGDPVDDLAKRHGVHPNQIRMIRRSKRWKWLDSHDHESQSINRSTESGVEPPGSPESHPQQDEPG